MECAGTNRLWGGGPAHKHCVQTQHLHRHAALDGARGARDPMRRIRIAWSFRSNELHDDGRKQVEDEDPL